MNKSSLFLVTALAATAVSAQGAFDFSKLRGLPSEPTVQVDLPAAMLSFVTQAAGQTDPAAAKALAGIRGVRLRVYEDLDETAPVLDTIEQATRMLESEGWERMVYVNDGDDKVRMYVKLGDQKLTGMTVMVFDGGGEAVFVNIDGTIEPATLGQIASRFGMGGMLDELTGLQSLGAGALGHGGAPAPSDTESE